MTLKSSTSVRFYSLCVIQYVVDIYTLFLYFNFVIYSKELKLIEMLYLNFFFPKVQRSGTERVKRRKKIFLIPNSTQKVAKTCFQCSETKIETFYF